MHNKQVLEPLVRMIFEYHTDWSRIFDLIICEDEFAQKSFLCNVNYS